MNTKNRLVAEVMNFLSAFSRNGHFSYPTEGTNINSKFVDIIMKFGRCNNCGEYMYIQSKGLCRYCYTECGIEPHVVCSQQSVKIPANRVDELIHLLADSRYCNQVEYFRNGLTFLSYSEDDSRDDNIHVADDGMISIYAKSEHIFGEIYDWIENIKPNDIKISSREVINANIKIYESRIPVLEKNNIEQFCEDSEHFDYISIENNSTISKIIFYKEDPDIRMYPESQLITIDESDREKAMDKIVSVRENIYDGLNIKNKNSN